MNLIEEILLLKRSFCEFFVKLLPTIKDPCILTRTRWHQFRNVLLDEYKTTQDIYDYVKQLNFTESMQLKSGTESKRVEPMPEVAEPVQQQQLKDVFVKQPSKRNLSIKPSDTQRPSTNKPSEEFARVNIQRGKFVEAAMNVQKIDKISLLNRVKDAIGIIRKHSTTLGMVYNKSFEINTSELEPTQLQLDSIAASRQAHHDLLQLQQAQRNATLKGYSIYAKKDKDLARQRVEEYANNYQNQRKVYV